MPPRLPVRYESRPLGGWLGGIFSLVLAAAGAWVIPRTSWWFGGSLMIMGATAAFIAFAGLRTDSFYLTLGQEGFEYSGVFRKKFVPWHHVEQFVYIGGEDYEAVGWQYTQGSGLARPGRRFVWNAFSDMRLPTTYRGITPRELVELLNSLLKSRGG